MTVQPGLCRTRSELQIVGFLTHRLIYIIYIHVPAASELVVGFEVPTAKLKPEPGATVTGVGLNPKPVNGVVELGPPIVFVADN